MAQGRSIAVVAALDLSEPGGAVMRTCQLASLLARAGNEVRLVGFGDSDRRQAGILDGGVVVDLVPDHCSRLERHLLGLFGQIGGTAGRRSLLRRLRSLLEPVRRPDCVLLYNQDPSLAWSVSRLCRAAGVLFVQQYAEMHIAADYSTRWMHAYFLREQFHLKIMPLRADGNIVISSTLRDLVLRGGAKNVIMLPSFVDVEYWETAIARGNRKRVDGRVLYAGEGARRDCLDIIIKAAAHCRGNGRRVALRLVGLTRRSGQQCMNLARGLGISDGVQLVGRLDHTQLAGEYAEAAATILLRSDDRSSRACFPTRLGEMLLSGRPVIMSDIPDYNLVFAHGENAYLAKPGDVESVAQCLLQATENNERNARIGANGREVARTRLNVESHAAEVARWLDRLSLARSVPRVQKRIA